MANNCTKCNITKEESQGRYADLKVSTLSFDPHETHFDRYIEKGLTTKLSSLLRSALSDKGIYNQMLPEQTYLDTGKSIMILLNKIPNQKNANYVKVVITGDNGSTRVELKIETNISRFKEVKRTILDYIDSIHK